MFKKNIILLLLISLFLTGCSTEVKKTNEKNENVKKIEAPKENNKNIKNYRDIDSKMTIEAPEDIDPGFSINVDTSGIDDGIVIDNYDEETKETVNVEMITAYKPVIYLYPEEKTKVNITLDLKGKLTSSYPEYKENLNGWNVIAYPDGNLEDENNEKYNSYPYIFWEGNLDTKFDLSEGFVVRGSDTSGFLQRILSEMGLNSREYADFITYWMPKMKDNPWNLITFQSKEYTEAAKLNVNPKPDTCIRIFMVWKALEEPIDIKEPDVSKLNLFPERKGFTLIEWGGTEIL